MDNLIDRAKKLLEDKEESIKEYKFIAVKNPEEYSKIEAEVASSNDKWVVFKLYGN